MEKKRQNLNTRGNKVPQWLEKKIALLKHGNLPRLGRWEIAKKAEPISASFADNAPVDLFAVVHEESYFVMSMRVLLPDKTYSGTRTLVEAMEKHQVLPEILLVRDEKLYDELTPIADAFNFTLARVRRLKAIPQVFRAMTGILP